MKFCKQCGAQMSDQSMYCPRCGAAMSAGANEERTVAVGPNERPAPRGVNPNAYAAPAPGMQQPYRQPAAQPVYPQRPAYPQQPMYTPAAPSPLAQPAVNVKTPALTLVALFMAFLNMALQFIPHFSDDGVGMSVYSTLNLASITVKAGESSWADFGTYHYGSEAVGIMFQIGLICLIAGLVLTMISAIIMVLPYAAKAKASFALFIPMVLSVVVSLAGHALYFIGENYDAWDDLEFGNWIGLFIYFAVALIAVVYFIVAGVTANKEKKAAA